ncbi:hypothetical protein THAOC_31953 [Thalassiosira oceanica]|uniref:Nudix hydrolase domain-containing protein n=1 Tax=Thalassiosira oceanica TaxID=159749 RepID=K0R896_THAOC|nr:hypothetical protein THAOC_31953 [Thalassiosira oceanica]|eukprot:EJK49200.1 hypothetical protein THAOC_31953 [Thalassiosira oceanica]
MKGTGLAISLLRAAEPSFVSGDAATQFARRRTMALRAAPAAQSDAIPRAAVAVTVRLSHAHDDEDPKWLLIKRGKEPNRGMWSICGGSIESFESTMDAAKRELFEETKLRGGHSVNLRWHEGGPFTSTDAIVPPYHYVISHAFAEIRTREPDEPPLVASDDALDAAWWSYERVVECERKGKVSPGVSAVLRRANILHINGLLPC